MVIRNVGFLRVNNRKERKDSSPYHKGAESVSPARQQSAVGTADRQQLAVGPADMVKFMIELICTFVVAFGCTNIDDILVLMVLLAQAGNRRARVAAGYALGVAALTACAMAVGAGLSAIPSGWLRWLGIVPVALGVKVCFGKDDDSVPGTASMLGVALITVGNGGDNLGVYVPLFAGCSAQELTAAAATFAVMTAVWLALAARLASLPALKRLIETRSRILVPMIYILLGLYILFF